MLNEMRNPSRPKSGSTQLHSRAQSDTDIEWANAIPVEISVENPHQVCQGCDTTN